MATSSKGWLTFALAVLLATACFSSSPTPPPENPRDPRTGEPALEGSRYETMRVLARSLAERSAAARDEALAQRRERAGEEALSRMSELVDRSRQFHRRLENYTDPPRYIAEEVRGLDSLVRDIDSRVRYARLPDRAERSWRDVVDVMERMNRLSTGEDVDLPPAGGREGPVFPTDTSSSPDEAWRSGPGLNDRERDHFRRLSRELAVRATLAHEGAARAGSAYSERERGLLRNLDDFRSRARDLERRADSSALDRRELRPVVEGLADYARTIDRDMRDGGLQTGIWSDWTEVLLLLRRMSDLVRY